MEFTERIYEKEINGETIANNCTSNEEQRAFIEVTSDIKQTNG